MNPGADGRFGHHLTAAGVLAFLGVQRGHAATVAEDFHRAAAGGVVGARQALHAVETETVAADRERLPRFHRDLALLQLRFHQQRADQEHGDAAVRQHHADHLGGQRAAVRAQALPDETRCAQRDPDRTRDAGRGFPRAVGCLEVSDGARHQRQHRPRQQHAQRARDVVALPADQRPQRQQQHDRRHQNDEQQREIRRAHRNLAQFQRIGEQRIQRADQHHRAGGGEEHIVEQQQGFPRCAGKRLAAVGIRCAQRVQQQRTADHQTQENQDEQAASRIRGEGVHAGQHARAHQEGAEQRQRKCRDGQQQGPAAETAALFGDRLRMQQGCTGQPGHEAGVFDRIPEPPAAPAQFVIGPPAAQCDADGQARPGDVGPRPRPAQPARNLFRPRGVAVEQRRDRERERDRETHVAHVEHRRMHDQAEVLQQRIEVAAFGRGRENPLERVAGENQEGQKADADDAHHAQHAGDHRLRQRFRECGHRRSPQRKDQRPQQQRALVRAPHRRVAIHHGQQRIGIGGDIAQREVLRHERPGEDRERHADQHQLRPRRRPGDVHPRRQSALRAEQRQRRLQQGNQQREHQGDLTELRKQMHAAQRSGIGDAAGAGAAEAGSGVTTLCFLCASPILSATSFGT